MLCYDTRVKVKAERFSETLATYHINTRPNNAEEEAAWLSETLVFFHINIRCYHPEDGRSTAVRNVDILLQYYTVS
jgi:hypothetical protein